MKRRMSQAEASDRPRAVSGTPKRANNSAQSGSGGRTWGVGEGHLFPHLVFRIAQHFGGLLLYRPIEIERADRFESRRCLLRTRGANRTGLGDSETARSSLTALISSSIFFPGSKSDGTPVLARHQNSSPAGHMRRAIDPAHVLGQTLAGPCRFTGLSGSSRRPRAAPHNPWIRACATPASGTLDLHG